MRWRIKTILIKGYGPRKQYPRFRAEVQFASSTKRRCMAPFGLTKFRQEVALAGIPQLLQHGPIRLTASGCSHRMTHMMSLSCREPYRMSKSRESCWCHKVHCPFTWKVALIHSCASIPRCRPKPKGPHRIGPSSHAFVAFATPANKSRNWNRGHVAGKFLLHISSKHDPIRI